MSQVDIYLKIDGIPGDSTAVRHEDEIVIVSYQSAVNASRPSISGGGAGVGKTQFAGIKFRKNIDKASVPLLLACSSGRHLKQASFNFERPGEFPFKFYTVTLDDVFVSDLAQAVGHPAVAVSEPAGFLEEVTLQFGRIRWVFTSQNADGSQAPPIEGGWDVEGHEQL